MPESPTRNATQSARTAWQPKDSVRSHHARLNGSKYSTSVYAAVPPQENQRMNVALAANGGVASSSSNYNDPPYSYTAAGANNGVRSGAGWLQGEGWNDAAPGNTFPDWLQIDFNGNKAIDEVNVFMVQDNWENPVEPTETLTFSLYGLTGFEVQYWNGSAWATVPGGSVSNNNKVWKRITFSQITTSKIRVLTMASPDGYSRLTEVEAWGPAPPRTNVALAANGGVASSSSNYNDPPYSYTAAGANNGVRSGAGWLQGEGWNDAAPGNTFPDWLQIDFNGSKTIDEIDVFTVQDNYANPSEPTEAMTFSLYGLTGFDVQYWNGGAWTTVAGSITSNNKVWKRITFAPINTTKIRVLTNASPDGYSRITEVEAWTASATNSGSTSSDGAMARLDPRNRTGTGGEDLLSNNFNWNLPLVGLPGRGLDLGLTLSYNSLVWTRSGNYISFDLDQGSIAPGFRLGFPTIEGPYWNPDASANFYLLVTPSGARVELRQVGTSDVYEAKDSSYLQLTDNSSQDFSLLLRSTDGSQLRFEPAGGGWRCKKITDRNGNFITVTYESWGEIKTVTDTLGRVIRFVYDTNDNLSCITQGWNGQPAPTTCESQPHVWATFGWGTAPIGNNFPELTKLGPNSTSIPVLTQVGLPDGSRYNFGYTAKGQVSNISRAASDNLNHSYTVYEYDSPTEDCPRLTQTRTWATNWSDQEGVPHEVATSFGHDADGGCRLTMPDGTVYKEFYGNGWQSGLTTETRNYATAPDANANVWQKKTTTTWTQDNTGAGYLTNPRVTETNIYDLSGNRRRTTVDYGAYSQWGLPHIVKEYAADGATELRRTQTDYNLSQAYLSARIIGLVSSSTLYDSIAGQWQAKTTYEYDTTAIDAQAAAAAHHDQTYNSSFTTRGNVTSVSRWDVTDISNVSKALTSTVTYNAAGSTLSTTDPAGHTTSISYTDSFSDGINHNTFAYPTTVKDADWNASSAPLNRSLIEYNFDFGAKTRVEGPPPQNQPNGAIQTFAYDGAARILQVTTQSNGAYTRYVYGADYVESFSTVNNVTDEAYTFQLLNGRGQVFIAGSNHPGSLGGYKAQTTYYDVMGRVMKQSNPTEITNIWAPVGDDEAGWQYNNPTEYDWQGRVKKTFNMDGTYKEASYSGCGCAGGEVVTLTDEVGRRQKVFSDVLGRQRKSEILNWDGTVYSATTNTFNSRDQVTLTRQWAGAENGGGAYQDTTMGYDGYGRLQSKHVPEQQDANGNPTYTTWDYNSDDTIQKVTDARGATATYGYNNRHLPTAINYSAPAGITAASNVSYSYDAAGNRTSMTDGLGTQSYVYNQLSQMTSETRTFNDPQNPTINGVSKTISYTEYNLAGQLKSLTDPVGSRVDYVHDATGRLTTATGSGAHSAPTYASNLQYRAWGGLKDIDFGNATHQWVNYNARLQPSTAELRNVNLGGNPNATMTWNFDYYTDGRLNHGYDVSDNRFDRKLDYDHAGRTKEAYSGREARGEAPTNPADSPYRQSFGFDAFDNMTNRSGRFWRQEQLPESTTYTNNRRAGWTHDAAGNVLADNTHTNAFDAVGQQTQTFGPMNGCGLEYEITQTHDGDARPVKRLETTRDEDVTGDPPQQNCTNTTTTTYYLYSSALGGAKVVELDATGNKVKGYVYGNGQRLAKQEVWIGGFGVTYHHSNPATNSWAESNIGRQVERKEIGPLGEELGVYDPYLIQWSLPATPSYTDILGDLTPLFESGDPFNFSSGCSRQSGMPGSCSRAAQGRPTFEFWGQRIADLPGFGTNWGSFAELAYRQHGIRVVASAHARLERRREGNLLPRDGEMLRALAHSFTSGLFENSSPQKPSQTQTPCERKLASMFGGENAFMRTRYDVYSNYRGEDSVAALAATAWVARYGMPTTHDPIWDSEHLFNSPHLSGNSAGTANTDIYVPGNFQGQPTRPSPTAGVVLINYAQLGNLTNVTLAIYHVGNFGVQRMTDGRVRIGTTGGPGGGDAGNLHSHFEIWNGRYRNVVDGRERFARRLHSFTTTFCP